MEAPIASMILTKQIEIESLRKQLAACKKDAERYRWLAGVAEGIYGANIDWETSSIDYGAPDPTLADAIDAAMENQNANA